MGEHKRHEKRNVRSYGLFPVHMGSQRKAQAMATALS
jgi:hypothetical protein